MGGGDLVELNDVAARAARRAIASRVAGDALVAEQLDELLAEDDEPATEARARELLWRAEDCVSTDLGGGW